MKNIEIKGKIVLNRSFKAILLISAIILILSLYIPTIGIENKKVQILSTIGLIYGLMAWLVNDITIETKSYKNEIMWESLKITEEKYYLLQAFLLFVALLFFIDYALKL